MDYKWLNEDSRTVLERGYLLPGQSPEERIEYIAEYAEKLLDGKYPGFAKKFIDYMSRGFYSLASPIWSNYGLERGLPISCFGTYIPDSVAGIADAHGEVMMQNKVGGGTSGYFGDIRPRGAEISNNGKTNGTFSFARLFDLVVDVVSQGTTRKGQFAGYIDIEHPDVREWLNIRTEGNLIQTMFYGVCVSNSWLSEMEEGDKEKREVWANVMQSRKETGIPYIFFKDNANEGRPQMYKDRNMPILASNLCSEIMLPSNIEESFVCCLSSMNLEFYDEWKNTNAVEVLTIFLDTVLTDFIEKARYIPYMSKTVGFAKRHRAIGVGALGWHTYLQKKRISFGSYQAYQANNEIFKFIKEKTYAASTDLAVQFNEPFYLRGYGRRNSTTMAIAPTKSSSFILGQVSASIEPYTTNYGILDGAKIKTLWKNPILEEFLEEKGKNTPEVWEEIRKNDGSVSTLDFLSEDEKKIFRVYREISPLDIVQQAAQRQKYIDQGQSLNLYFPGDTPIKFINRIILDAAAMGIKSLYYQNSKNAAQKFNQNLMECEGCSS